MLPNFPLNASLIFLTRIVINSLFDGHNTKRKNIPKNLTKTDALLERACALESLDAKNHISQLNGESMMPATTVDLQAIEADAEKVADAKHKERVQAGLANYSLVQ